uniref:Uncharacterized protein n=1 Tax=Amphimedon queenslandica TaxID=400682 RepID=A0A1X7V5Y4_AMPQE
MKGVDFENTSYDSKWNAASSLLLVSVLKNRSHKVGILIHASNNIRKLLNSFSDFGEKWYTKNSEPYFYESAYLYCNDNSDSQLDSPIAIPVDTDGICYVARIVDESCIDRTEECNDDSASEYDNFGNNSMYTNKKKPTLKWHCTDRCKPLLESDVSSIIEVRCINRSRACT